MSQVHIAYDAGEWRCYRVSGSGKGRAYIGCGHRIPRSAMAHSDSLADPTPETPDPVAVPFPASGVFPAPPSVTPIAVSPAAVGERTCEASHAVPTTPGVPDGYALSGSPEVAGSDPDHSASPPGDLVLGLT